MPKKTRRNNKRRIRRGGVTERESRRGNKSAHIVKYNKSKEKFVVRLNEYKELIITFFHQYMPGQLGDTQIKSILDNIILEINYTIAEVRAMKYISPSEFTEIQHRLVEKIDNQMSEHRRVLGERLQYITYVHPAKVESKYPGLNIHAVHANYEKERVKTNM